MSRFLWFTKRKPSRLLTVDSMKHLFQLSLRKSAPLVMKVIAVAVLLLSGGRWQCLQAQPIQAAQFWPDGVYLAVNTYTWHSWINWPGAADFFFVQQQNRPDHYVLQRLGQRAGIPLLAPFDGEMFLDFYERSPGYVGEFQRIDPVSVINGTASIPRGSFEFFDAGGRLRLISVSILVDAGTHRVEYTHSTAHEGIFSEYGNARVRAAFSAMYNATSSSLIDVVVRLDHQVQVGEQVAILYGWDAANTHAHVHFNFYRGSGFGESNIDMGNLVDLSDPNGIMIGGQIILDSRYQVSRWEDWLPDGWVYQYPAMPRNEFAVGEQVVVLTGWEHSPQNETELRSNASSPSENRVANGSQGIILAGPQLVDDRPGSEHWALWYQVDFSGVVGWVRSPWLDRSPDSPPNQAPSVAMVRSYSTARVGNAVSLSATASDPDGTVQEVAFFANGDLIGSDPDPAGGWTLSWNPLPEGTVMITAQARDDDDATTVSDPIPFLVAAADALTDELGETAPSFRKDITNAKVEDLGGSLLFGDGSKAVPLTTTTAGAITWEVARVASVQCRIGLRASTPASVTLHASPDGTVWSQLAVTSQRSLSADDYWTPSDLVFNGLPTGTRYIRATLSAIGCPNFWDATLSRIDFSYADNNPPVLASPGNRSVQAGQSLQFVLNASDQDGQPITFSATGGSPDN